MQLSKIKKYPDVVLRKKCSFVQEVTDRELALLDDMFYTMRHFAGIGLAAPQVGVARRLIVADIGAGPVKLANPVILKSKGMDSLEEGCLSVPSIAVNVQRPEEVVVAGLDEKGRQVEIKAKGLLARVLQHEIDHLNGTLIIDYLTSQEEKKMKGVSL